MGDFCLQLKFNDGFEIKVDLNSLIKSPPPVFEPLKDPKNFEKIYINPVGGISWECGADLSAEYLYGLK